MISVKPFKAEDMLWVISHGIKEIGLKAIPNDEMKTLAEEREKSGKCLTGWVDGEVVGVAGIDEVWPGITDVVDMWLMLTPYIDRHIVQGYKCILEGMKKLINENKLRRVQSYGRVDFPACHILFEHLGFNVEGLAKAYTPDGVDCIMYAKVK